MHDTNTLDPLAPVEPSSQKPVRLTYGDFTITIPTNDGDVRSQIEQARSALVRASTLLRGLLASPMLDAPAHSGEWPKSSLVDALDGTRQAIDATRCMDRRDGAWND